MAKPTKHAMSISIVVGAIALIGIILGLIFENAVIALVLILPTIIYEIYRVEGKSTIWASWGLLVTFIAELILLIFNISFDLASFLDSESEYFQGYEVPLTDIKVVGPVVMGILAVVLFKNTRGKYTKLLSVFIFLSAFAIVYMLDPEIFTQLLKVATGEGIDMLNSQ